MPKKLLFPRSTKPAVIFANRAVVGVMPLSDVAPGTVCDREGAVWVGNQGFADCFQDAVRFQTLAAVRILLSIWGMGQSLGYAKTTSSPRTGELVDSLARTLPPPREPPVAFVHGRHQTDESNEKNA